MKKIDYSKNIDTLKLPTFTKEKLKELVHYTDQEENPTYDALNSNAFYKIFCGAKGVSKSFSKMIHTVYRIVNEKNFNSVWCRNQYNHIQNTLKPMLIKVLDFLAMHGLNFKECFNITSEAAYWNIDDGGSGRAIFFQNWQKIQAFQGFTLKDVNFRFGELVIDEPLEDTSETNKLPHELIDLYTTQEDKLPLLIQNTVLREVTPEDFKIEVYFLYNIFTTQHFLITNYHQKVIKLINENGSPNQETLNELINKHFIFKENLELFDGLGLCAVMFGKFFVPSSTISPVQLKALQLMKEQNPRLWTITVAGFTFEDNNERINYFMKKVLYDENGNLNKNVKFIKKSKLKSYLDNFKVRAIYWGFDAGVRDSASLCGVVFLENSKIVVFELIEDIKNLINKKSKYLNDAINNKVAEIVNKWNQFFADNLPLNFKAEFLPFAKTSVICCDNFATIESLNIIFNLKKIDTVAIKAVRQPKQKFGILDRQIWQKFIFTNGLIELLPAGLELVKALSKQAILNDADKNEKRDETINKEIYDVINAFEMSCSYIFKLQYLNISNQLNQN